MNVNKKIFIIILLMFILLSVSCVSAVQNETIIDDDAGDVLTVEDNEVETHVNDADDLSTTEGSYTELNDEFQKGGVFTFDKNYSAGSGDGIINIKYSIEIDGAGHTIDAKGYTGIFQSDNGDYGNINVIIKNLIFKNANSPQDGGAIYVKGPENVKYTIINCTFIGNKANCAGGAIYFSSNDGTLEIINSTFTKNDAFEDRTWYDSDGGAIRTGGNTNLILNGCIFEQNRARHYGGAVYADSKSFTVTNCKFIHNEAFKKDGGAIYVADKISSIENTSFISNQGLYGGAIYISDDNDNDLTVKNCVFDTNKAISPRSVVHGGAIYNEGKKISVINSNFTGNYAYYSDYDGQSSKTYRGGAIYTVAELVVDGCIFTNNYACDYGGAIYADDSITWGDNPSSFINNHVDNGNNVYANKGGAIYVGKFNNNAKGLIFIHNTAWYGGAIYINNENEVTFDSCYFTDNVAMHKDGKSGCGAAIYLDSSSSKLSLTNNIFSNNRAYDDKAVYNCGYYTTVSHNWWAVNDPDFNSGYLIEWHKIGSNGKISDSNPLKLVLEPVDKKSASRYYDVDLILKFVDNTGNVAGNLINWHVTFKANKDAEFNYQDLKSNNATVVFTPTDTGDYRISAQVILYTVYLDYHVQGDFGTLQELVNDTEDGTLNLTRDYTYSEGADTITKGIVIDKPLIINGNGHTIDSKGHSRIFRILSDNVVINNLTLIGGYWEEIVDDDYGTVERHNYNVIEIENANNTLISNCIITNASDSGVHSVGGNNTTVDNCTFIYNDAGLGGALYLQTANSLVNNSRFHFNHARYGGAIYVTQPSATISNCEFLNNTADERAGAIRFDSGDNAIVDSCIFEYNRANTQFGGAAINWDTKNGTIRNSKFLNNKAIYPTLTKENAENTLIFTLTGENNYINAIRAEYDIKFENVTYWDGSVVTGNNPVKSENITGINVTIDIYKNNVLVKRAKVMTNASGQAKYDYFELEDGNYTYRAYHADDNYYGATYPGIEGSFTINRQSSSTPVTININDGQEFDFNNCTIPFTANDMASVRIVITNSSSGSILVDEYTDKKNYTVELPAGSYNITVYNPGNINYAPSKDSKLFKINKIASKITINPIIGDIKYGDNITVSFIGDTNSYNVEVMDYYNNVVFTQLVSNQSVNIPKLDVGEYTVIVYNLGDGGRNKSQNSTGFTIKPKENNIRIEVEDVEYGENVTVTIMADVDGEYTLKVNSTEIPVNVTNGTGMVSVSSLEIGSYSVNVEREIKNYVNNVTKATFDVLRVSSCVFIAVDTENVTTGEIVTIYLFDDHPAKYNITVYDNQTNVTMDNATINGTSYQLPDLPVGTYRITVINLGNENIAPSRDSVVLSITEDNYVEIFAENAEYGRDVFIYIYANVDGTYHININGTELDIEVTEGFGYFDDYLDLVPGNYSVNATFDDDRYTNIIQNATFEIFMGQSNIHIESLGNVTYGEDITLKFYDDYATEFHIIVKDSEGNVEWDLITDAFTFSLSGLDVGEYTAIVSNPGDEYIIGANDTIKFNILKAEDYLFDVDVIGKTVVVTLPSAATGNVTLNISGKTFNQTLIGGQAVFNLENIAYGDYLSSVSYAGDKNYVAISVNKTITVEKLSIVASDAKYGWSNTVDYQVKLVDDKGNVESNVTITFTVDGKTYNATTDANGVAKVTLSLNVGTYDVTATTINGDVVTKKITVVNRLTQNANVNMYYFDGSVFKVKAIGDDGNAVGAGQIVVIKLNKKTYKVKTDKNGIAKLKVPKTVKVGKYTVTATYKGQTVKNTVKVKQNLKLKKAKVKRSAKKLVLKATLKNGKKAVKGKKVTFKFKGKKFTAKTNKKGVAKVTIKKKVLKKLKKGKKVKYQVTYLKNTVKRTAKVKR